MTFLDQTPTQPSPRRFRRGALVVGALGLLTGGAAAGAIVASTTGADAATANATAGATGTTDNDGDHHRGGGHGLPSSGTVTAVGTDSVTIKTGTNETTYGVTADSDIDKSGEANLADLTVGDPVTFSTDTVNGATVIDKLHAGDESKNKPADPSPTATSTG